MGQINVGSRVVHFDDEAARLGVKHLLTLEPGEQESIFNATRLMPNTGFKFEDRDGRNFTLLRSSGGVYRVVRRGSDSGGWF